MFYLILNVLVGFLAHQVRPLTLRFEPRLGDLVRYGIGVALYLGLAVLRFHWEVRRLYRRGCPTVDEVMDAQGRNAVLTAGTLGAGVVAGFLLDG